MSILRIFLHLRYNLGKGSIARLVIVAFESLQQLIISSHCCRERFVELQTLLQETDGIVGMSSDKLLIDRIFLIKSLSYQWLQTIDGSGIHFISLSTILGLPELLVYQNKLESSIVSGICPLLILLLSLAAYNFQVFLLKHRNAIHIIVTRDAIITSCTHLIVAWFQHEVTPTILGIFLFLVFRLRLVVNTELNKQCTLHLAFQDKRVALREAFRLDILSTLLAAKSHFRTILDTLYISLDDKILG